MNLDDYMQRRMQDAFNEAAQQQFLGQLQGIAGGLGNAAAQYSPPTPAKDRFLDRKLLLLTKKGK